MDVLVSIITVAYNSALTISKTIESVLNQTYKNIEYIIVDGLSRDNTLEIAESYKEAFQHRNVSYWIISEKDNGIYDAMNKGIRLSHGDIVGMINSDDWYELDAVETMVQTYRDTQFDYFYADLRIINGDRKQIKHSKYRKHYVSSKDWNHPTSFVVRGIYNKMQYRNETLYDDFDLFLRIRSGKYKIVILNKVLANFSFGGVSNVKNIKQVLQRIKQRYYVYQKNNFSKFYIIECLCIETIKYILS